MRSTGAAWAGAPGRPPASPRTGLAGGARDGKAHLAAGRVGDAAHRVDGLEGRPGGDQQRRPASSFGWKKAIISSHSSCASSMRPSPISPQAWSPPPGPASWAPSARSLRHVALRGRVRPHLAVHRRRQQQRAALDGPRQAQQRLSSSSARPVASWPIKVGTGQRHQDRDRHSRVRLMWPWRWVRVSHWLSIAVGPSACIGQPGDELAGRFGHHHLHRPRRPS